MPRPRSDRPYICGPYPHRRKQRLVIYYPRSNGGRDRRIKSFDTAEAAKTWKRGFKIVTKAQGRTIADAVTEYIATLARKGNKDKSNKTARYRLDSILDTSRALIDLKPRSAQEYYDDLVDEGGAVDTHQGCLVQAKAFGRFCVKQKWLPANPFEAVDPVGKKSRGKEQLRIDEGRTFTAYCCGQWRSHQDRSAIAGLLPLLLNLRCSEVAQLTDRDVDDNGTLLWVGEQDAKTLAGRRRVRIPPVIRPAMVWLAANPATPEGHLFATEAGIPATRHWVAYHTRRLMKESGVKVVTTHGLRGTHATFATVHGETSIAVARSMGHEDPSMTDSTYIDKEQAAAAQVDRAEETFAVGVTTSLELLPTESATAMANGSNIMRGTPYHAQAPQASASTNSAIRAQIVKRGP